MDLEARGAGTVRLLAGLTVVAPGVIGMQLGRGTLADGESCKRSQFSKYRYANQWLYRVTPKEQRHMHRRHSMEARIPPSLVLRSQERQLVVRRTQLHGSSPP